MSNGKAKFDCAQAFVNNPSICKQRIYSKSLPCDRQRDDSKQYWLGFKASFLYNQLSCHTLKHMLHLFTIMRSHIHTSQRTTPYSNILLKICHVVSNFHIFYLLNLISHLNPFNEHPLKSSECKLTWWELHQGYQKEHHQCILLYLPAATFIKTKY